MSRPSAWTEDMLVRAEQLWRDGLSASKIAMKIGSISRHAVIGMAGRRKWGKRQERIGSERQKKRRNPFYPFGHRTKQRSQVPLPPKPPRQPPLPPDVRNLTLMELTPRTCKWPVNDPPPRGEYLFCGAPKDAGAGPYCCWHARLAFQPVNQRGERSLPAGVAA